MKNGFSLVEVLLAVSVFALMVTALVGSLIYGQESTALAGERSRAVMLADEGLEAARNIRDAGFSNLTNGTYGLAVSGNLWTLSGTSDTTDIFTRSLVISSIDANRKQIISTVSWQQNPQRTGSISAETYLTNWQGSPTPTPTPTPTTCNSYALSQGYSAGTCRQNTTQCINNGETHLTGGDALCTGGSSADTCCALALPTPTPTPSPSPSTCAVYCQSLGTYTTGTCRQNTQQCSKYDETYESGGDQYCDGPSDDTCCCKP